MNPPEQAELFDKDLDLPWSKGFLRMQEVATHLDCSVDQVQRLIDSGGLEAVSISADPARAERQHRRITARSLHALINRRRREL
jgi:hypothetical protein